MWQRDKAANNVAAFPTTTPQPAAGAPASQKPQDPPAEKQKFHIFVGPCVSLVIIALFIWVAYKDLNSGSNYAGLTSFILSFLVGVLIIIICAFSIGLSFKRAKYRKAGLVVNILMMVIGLSPQIFLQAMQTGASVDSARYEAMPKVQVCRGGSGSGWSCGNEFINPDVSSKSECLEAGGKYLAKGSNVKIEPAYGDSSSYAAKSWVCVITVE